MLVDVSLVLPDAVNVTVLLNCVSSSSFYMSACSIVITMWVAFCGNVSREQTRSAPTA